MLNINGPSFELFFYGCHLRTGNTEQKQSDDQFRRLGMSPVCPWTNMAWTNGSSLFYVRVFICQMGSPLVDFCLAKLLCRAATKQLRVEICLKVPSLGLATPRGAHSSMQTLEYIKKSSFGVNTF